MIADRYKRPVFIATLWEDRQLILLGAPAYTAASASLSTGLPITLADESGLSRAYPPTLQVAEIVEALDVEADSIRFSFVPNSADRAAIPPNLLSGWGELALIDLSIDGLTVASWADRRVLVAGPVVDVAQASPYEPIEVTVQQESLADRGSIWPSDMVINSERWPDTLANSDDRARAQQSNGLLPPIPICRSASYLSLWSPLPVVQDEDSAVNAVSDLVYRRYLITSEALNDTSTSRTVRFLKPTSERSYYSGGSYVSVPQTATDALGSQYHYAEGWAVATTANITLTAASATGQSAVTLAPIEPGDQIRLTADGADAYEVVSSLDGLSLQLSANYGGAGGTGGGTVVKIPKDQSYPAFIAAHEGGGIVGPRGGALGNPAELIEWILRRADLSIPADIASLGDLRPRLAAWEVCTVLAGEASDSKSPLAWIQEHLLPILPIGMARANGQIRFFWTGPACEECSEWTFDLSDDQGVVRSGAVTWTPESEQITEVQLSYAWDILTNRCRVGLTASGYPRVSKSQLFWRPIARAASTVAGRSDLKPNRLTLTTDVIADEASALATCAHLLWARAQRKRRVLLEVASRHRWIEPGTILSLTEADSIDGTLVCRVLSIQRRLDGSVLASTEELPR